MPRTIFLLVSVIFSALFPLAQNLPEMVLIEGGTSIIGGGYQYEIQDYRIHYLGHDRGFDSLNLNSHALGEVPEPNNPNMQVTVADFYLSPTEVTNAEYRNFLIDSLLPAKDQMKLKKLIKSGKKSNQDAINDYLDEVYKQAGQTALMPDEDVWTRDFAYSYNEPLKVNYFKHPAFAEYPVVGVSWIQAKVYCAFISRANNAERVGKGLPLQADFRLPTEVEWEYAARGVLPKPDNSSPERTKTDRRLHQIIYPWPGKSLLDEKAQYRANIKVGSRDYESDGFMYAAPVTSYSPNGFGLFNMAGNVSEWVEDVFRIHTFQPIGAGIEPNYGSINVRKNPRVIKGGSWADYYFASMCGSRSGIYQDQGSARVGFRVARTKVGGE